MKGERSGGERRERERGRESGAEKGERSGKGKIRKRK
jgi:hypothetical protein